MCDEPLRPYGKLHLFLEDRRLRTSGKGSGKLGGKRTKARSDAVPHGGGDATKRLRRDHQGSVRAFQEVSAHYDKWFGVHLRSKTKISEELISSIGTPEWKPYKSRVYERVMLRLYQALNFMELGKQGRARAEIFKTRQAVQDAKELWNAELTASRELMSKKGIDLDKGFNRAEANQLKEETDRLKAMIPSDLGDYVKPAAIYLETLIFCMEEPKEMITKKRFSRSDNCMLFIRKTHGF